MGIEGERVDEKITDGSGKPAGEEEGPQSVEDAVNAALDSKEPDDSIETEDLDTGTPADKGQGKPEDKPEGKPEDKPEGKPDDKKAGEELSEEEAAKKKAEEEEKKKAEEDPYAMPEELKAEGKEKTRERFETLVNMNKEKDARLEAAGQQVGAFQSLIETSGANPQEFAQLIEFSSLVKSGQPENLQRALNILDMHRNNIAIALGVDLPGADLLKDFPDLQQKVDNLDITREGALEIARSRMQQQQQQQRQQSERQTQEQQQEHQAAVQTAQGDLNNWDNFMKENDPDYAFKRQIIFQQIPQIVQSYPPRLWLPQVRAMYDTISATAQMRSEIEPQGERPPNPLRKNETSSSSGQTREPASTLDAVNAALGVSNG